jgi:hypothetical protein
LDVDESDVRSMLFDDGQRGVKGIGLADHDDVVRGLEHLFGPRPQNLVIVDHDDPKGSVSSLGTSLGMR